MAGRVCISDDLGVQDRDQPGGPGECLAHASGHLRRIRWLELERCNAREHVRRVDRGDGRGVLVGVGESDARLAGHGVMVGDSPRSESAEPSAEDRSPNVRLDQRAPDRSYPDMDPVPGPTMPVEPSPGTPMYRVDVYLGLP